MTREANYSPISDLARLFCSLQRERADLPCLPDLDTVMQRLEENLDLGPFSYVDEIEAAIIDALERT